MQLRFIVLEFLNISSQAQDHRRDREGRESSAPSSCPTGSALSSNPVAADFLAVLVGPFPQSRSIWKAALPLGLLSESSVWWYKRSPLPPPGHWWRSEHKKRSQRDPFPGTGCDPLTTALSKSGHPTRFVCFCSHIPTKTTVFLHSPYISNAAPHAKLSWELPNFMKFQWWSKAEGWRSSQQE